MQRQNRSNENEISEEVGTGTLHLNAGGVALGGWRVCLLWLKETFLKQAKNRENRKAPMPLSKESMLVTNTERCILLD